MIGSIECGGEVFVRAMRKHLGGMDRLIILIIVMILHFTNAGQNSSDWENFKYV